MQVVNYKDSNRRLLQRYKGEFMKPNYKRNTGRISENLNRKRKSLRESLTEREAEMYMMAAFFNAGYIDIIDSPLADEWKYFDEEEVDPRNDIIIILSDYIEFSKDLRRAVNLDFDVIDIVTLPDNCIAIAVR